MIQQAKDERKQRTSTSGPMAKRGSTARHKRPSGCVYLPVDFQSFLVACLVTVNVMFHVVDHTHIVCAYIYFSRELGAGAGVKVYGQEHLCFCVTSVPSEWPQNGLLTE